jgi:hypothetical protein
MTVKSFITLGPREATAPAVIITLLTNIILDWIYLLWTNPLAYFGGKVNDEGSLTVNFINVNSLSFHLISILHFLCIN